MERRSVTQSLSLGYWRSRSRSGLTISLKISWGFLEDFSGFRQCSLSLSLSHLLSFYFSLRSVQDPAGFLVSFCLFQSLLMGKTRGNYCCLDWIDWAVFPALTGILRTVITTREWRRAPQCCQFFTGATTHLFPPSLSLSLSLSSVCPDCELNLYFPKNMFLRELHRNYLLIKSV